MGIVYANSLGTSCNISIYTDMCPLHQPTPSKYIYRQLVLYIDFVTLMATCHKHVMRVNVEEWFIKIAIRQWRIKDLFVYAMTAVCISEC